MTLATAVASLFLSQLLGDSGYGTIQGELIYPSDVLPAQKVCAEDILVEKSYCTETRQNQESYRLQLPSGVYRVFAVACKVKSYEEDILCQDGYSDKRAYYTDFAICGITAECEEATSGYPIPFRVKPGNNLLDINPQDWYRK